MNLVQLLLFSYGDRFAETFKGWRLEGLLGSTGHRLSVLRDVGGAFQSILEYQGIYKLLAHSV